jgi:hypothetical protein
VRLSLKGLPASRTNRKDYQNVQRATNELLKSIARLRSFLSANLVPEVLRPCSKCDDFNDSMSFRTAPGTYVRSEKARIKLPLAVKARAGSFEKMVAVFELGEWAQAAL